NRSKNLRRFPTQTARKSSRTCCVGSQRRLTIFQQMTTSYSRRTSCLPISIAASSRLIPVPLRGEVWFVDLGIAAKVRPALVLSVPAGEADRAVVTLVPHDQSAAVALRSCRLIVVPATAAPATVMSRRRLEPVGSLD